MLMPLRIFWRVLPNRDFEHWNISKERIIIIAISFILSLIQFLSIKSKHNNYKLKTSPKNAYIFAGSKNKIQFLWASLTDFSCNFDLSWFPFGTQRCSMEMTPDRNGVVILLRNVSYTGKYY